MNFHQYVTEAKTDKGWFTKLKNKLKYAGNDLGEKKHYYAYKNKTLIARITILEYDIGNDYVKFESEDIVSGKKVTSETTVKGWYDLDYTGGWIEYSDDEQSRAFNFLHSQYNNDTEVTLKAGVNYILNDTKKVTGKDRTFTVKKQKINKALDLVVYQGETIDGNEISFNPTEIAK